MIRSKGSGFASQPKFVRKKIMSMIQMILYASQLAVLVLVSTAQVSEESKSGGNLEPLKFPILGSASEMKIGTWLFSNDNPTYVDTSFSNIDFRCGQDTRNAHQTMTPRSMFFGTLQHRFTTPKRPSSVIKLESDRAPIFNDATRSYVFCIKTMTPGNHISKLLSKYENKMVSFWWDSSEILNAGAMKLKPVGELAIGGMNPEKFVRGTQVRIKVMKMLSPNFPMSAWKPFEDLVISVGNNPKNYNKGVVFDAREHTFIPRDLYDAITRNIRAELGYTVGLLKGLPQDTTRNIMEYAGVEKPIDEFDCKYASKLLPLHIGPLTIPTSLMFKRLTAEKCKMTLPVNHIPVLDYTIDIGIDIIRNFYFSIKYDNANGDTLQFAQLRSENEEEQEENIPPPPASPESPRLAVSGDSTSSRPGTPPVEPKKCCAIS